MKLKNNETDQDSVKDKSVTGFRFSIRIVHSTLNTAFSLAASLFDFQKLRFACKTVRGGKEFDNIRNTPLKPILKAMALRDLTYANMIYNTKNVVDEVIEESATEYNTYEMNFELLFESGIVLKGNDYAQFTLNVSNGFFANGSIDTSKSYVIVEPIVGVTKEYAPPVITVIPVKEGAQNPSFSLGDNVTLLALVNMSDADYKESNRIIKNVSLKTDVFTSTLDFQALVASKNLYTDGYQTFLRDQSFIILDADDTDFDRVTLDLDLDDSKVTLSDNYIVVFQSVTDALTFEKQDERTERQDDEKIERLTAKL